MKRQNDHLISVAVGMIVWLIFRFLRLSMNLSTNHVTRNNFPYEEYFEILSSRQLQVPSTAKNIFTFLVSNNFWFSVSSNCLLTGQEELSFRKNDGPSNRLDCFNSWTSHLLETMSAGLWSVGTCRHKIFSDHSWFSSSLFDTQVASEDGCVFTQWS